MSKDIHIQAFQFLGGNLSELDKRSERSASREWQEIVEKLASKAPNVFPTCPSQREIEQTADLTFINVPMIEPGMRAHTVYFAVNAAGGRAFFNVLCFSYHGESVSLRELAALSPSDWWSICERLTASDAKLTLPEKDTELELPEWDGKKALFFRVPGFGGGVIHGEFEDWRETLQQASPPEYEPPPEPMPSPKVNIKHYLICFSAVAALVGVVCSLPKLIHTGNPTVPTEEPTEPTDEPTSTTEEPISDSEEDDEQEFIEENNNE